MRRPTKKEREERVLDLYYNKKMTYREIAELERMCPRDIGRIVNKESKDIESEQTMSKASKAYKMFRGGASPIDVAIALDLREPEVTKLYAESVKLGQIYDLNHIYQETKGNPAPLVKLYKYLRAEGLKAEDVVRIMVIANNDLPSVEYKCEAKKVELASLEEERQSRIRVIQDYDTQIAALGKRFADTCLACQEEGDNLLALQQKRAKLEAFVRNFENNDPSTSRLGK
jgi:DNA polymerase III delta prime subunit